MLAAPETFEPEAFRGNEKVPQAVCNFVLVLARCPNPCLFLFEHPAEPMCYPYNCIMEAQSERITHKLWLGTLPADDPVQTFGGPGSGLECDGCDLVISPEGYEHELLMKNERVMHLHVVCANLWQILRESLPDWKPPPPQPSSL
jgi:hypothetical protein